MQQLWKGTAQRFVQPFLWDFVLGYHWVLCEVALVVNVGLRRGWLWTNLACRLARIKAHFVSTELFWGTFPFFFSSLIKVNLVWGQLYFWCTLARHMMAFTVSPPHCNWSLWWHWVFQTEEAGDVADSGSMEEDSVSRDVSDLPVYCDHLDWRRFIPPLPSHYSEHLFPSQGLLL